MIVFVIIILIIVYLRLQFIKLQQDTYVQLQSVKVQAGVPITGFPEDWHILLLHYVRFYAKLNEPEQAAFRNKIMKFLTQVKVCGVGFMPAHQDYLWVAASGVIPIFYLKNWMYPNLTRVVLHQQAFGAFEDKQGVTLYVAGLVDFKHMPQTIHLARNVLWHDVMHDTPSQVAIHEFIHWIDYQDQSIDGIPYLLLSAQSIQAWAHHMKHEIQAIHLGTSQINPYGASKPAEFLATVSEMYFKQPDTLQQYHPALYKMLHKMYKGD